VGRFGSRKALAIGAAVIAAIAVLAFLLFTYINADVKKARAAIDQFHGYYERSEYESVYGLIHPDASGGISKAEAQAALSEVFSRLGHVKSLSFACVTSASRGGHKTIRVEYEVTFDRGKAWESYDWREEGGVLRLLAYAVETGYEDGRPDWERFIAPAGIRPNAGSCSSDALLWWER
jgi:hypothetical protein